MKNTINKEELDSVIEVYNQYHNVLSTATVLGYSRSKTRKLLATAGILLSKKSKMILELYNKGHNVKEISDKLKLNIKTVNEYVPYHVYSKKDELKSKKTLANEKSKIRKNALNNSDDIIGLLKAFSGHRYYKYEYCDDGIIINNELINFDDERTKRLVDKIIGDAK